MTAQNQPQIVVANESIPDEVDFDKIEDKVRNDTVGLQIQTASVVYSSAER
jgi:hypothetical protein